MNLSDKIKIVAEWLENENNELLEEASDENLNLLAEAFVDAANSLKKAAEKISIEEDELGFSYDTLQEMAVIAEAYDNSGDPELQKQASVLDELLLTIAAPKDYVANFRKIEEQRTALLKEYYKKSKEESDNLNDVKNTLTALDKSEVFKNRKPDSSLNSTRVCPEHSTPLLRVGGTSEGSIWQCTLDHKIFNYQEGFTLADGTKVAPKSVSNQGYGLEMNTTQIFDNREQRANRNG